MIGKDGVTRFAGYDYGAKITKKSITKLGKQETKKIANGYTIQSQKISTSVVFRLIQLMATCGKLHFFSLKIQIQFLLKRSLGVLGNLN